MNSFLLGLQFLTRIRITKQESWCDEACGRSVKFFSLYGVIIGAVLAAGYYFCNQFFPPLITAVIILLLEVYITGGIHVDGFMDTMDGLCSGRPPAGMLEIMKNSRVGAYSTIGLGLLFLSKFSIYYEFPAEILMPSLIIMPVLGRWAMVIGITLFPYARPAGMGRCFHQYAGRGALPLASLCAAAASAALGWTGAVAFAVTGAWSYLFCRNISRKLGGLTGDIYGAVTELAQVVALLVIYLTATSLL